MWHFQIKSMRASSKEELQPSHPELEPSSQHGSHVVPEPPCLHNLQVRHVHVCTGYGRGVPKGRHSRQRPMAKNQ